MKIHDTIDDLKTNHIKEQLNEFGYTETDGLSYRELVNKLATCKAMEVNVEVTSESWF